MEKVAFAAAAVQVRKYVLCEEDEGGKKFSASRWMDAGSGDLEIVRDGETQIVSNYDMRCIAVAKDRNIITDHLVHPDTCVRKVDGQSCMFWVLDQSNGEQVDTCLKVRFSNESQLANFIVEYRKAQNVMYNRHKGTEKEWHHSDAQYEFKNPHPTSAKKTPVKAPSVTTTPTSGNRRENAVLFGQDSTPLPSIFGTPKSTNSNRESNNSQALWSADRFKADQEEEEEVPDDEGDESDGSEITLESFASEEYKPKDLPRLNHDGTDWRCESCRTMNPDSAKEKCLACDISRPGAEIPRKESPNSTFFFPASSSISSTNKPALDFSGNGNTSGFSFGASEGRSPVESSTVSKVVNENVVSHDDRSDEEDESNVEDDGDESDGSEISLESFESSDYKPKDLPKLKNDGTDWRCEICRTMNPDVAKEKCLACEKPRPGAEVPKEPPSVPTAFSFASSSGGQAIKPALDFSGGTTKSSGFSFGSSAGNAPEAKPFSFGQISTAPVKTETTKTPAGYPPISTLEKVEQLDPAKSKLPSKAPAGYPPMSTMEKVEQVDPTKPKTQPKAPAGYPPMSTMDKVEQVDPTKPKTQSKAPAGYPPMSTMEKVEQLDPSKANSNQGGGLLLGGTSSGNSLFNNSGATSTSSTLFGGVNTGSSLFGSASTGSSLFGTKATGSSLFGGTSSGGPLFSGTGSGSSLFGDSKSGVPNESSKSSNSSSSLFGGSKSSEEGGGSSSETPSNAGSSGSNSTLKTPAGYPPMSTMDKVEQLDPSSKSGTNSSETGNSPQGSSLQTTTSFGFGNTKGLFESSGGSMFGDKSSVGLFESSKPTSLFGGTKAPGVASASTPAFSPISSQPKNEAHSSAFRENSESDEESTDGEGEQEEARPAAASAGLGSSTGLGTFRQSTFGTNGFGTANSSNSGDSTNTTQQQSQSSSAPSSQPSFGSSSFGQPSFGSSSFGQPSFGSSSSGQPSFGQSSFGKPSFGQASFDNAQKNAPQNATNKSAPVTGGFSSFSGSGFANFSGSSTFGDTNAQGWGNAKK